MANPSAKFIQNPPTQLTAASTAATSHFTL
jgi:hypothetical protein